MAKLEQLINKLCPNGVPYKELGELANLITKQTGFDYSKTIKASLLSSPQDNCLPYIQTRSFSSKSFNFNTQFYIPLSVANRFPKIILNKKCLLISIVGSIGNVGLFPSGKTAFLGGAICVLKFPDNINIDYLFYCLESPCVQKQLVKKTKGSGQSTITVEDIRKFKVPYPPSEIQQEIVRILDKFSKLEEELEEELKKRRVQYEYYRDKLLDFKEGGASTKFVELCSTNRILRGKRLTSRDMNPNGKYNVYHGGIEPLGKYVSSNRKGDTVMIINVGASAGMVGYSKDDFWSSDGCFCLEHSEKYLNKFLYYFLLTKEHFLQTKVRKAGIPTLDNNIVERIRVPVISLQKQKDIVGILDKFDFFINNLSNGLPAEIDMRHKQYEYYRDKLLTFKELKNA